MTGYAIRRDSSYLTNGGDWSEFATNLFLTASLPMAKKVCKKHKRAVVVEVTDIQTGKVVYRQK
jgi:hypothetical protein